MRKRRKFFFTIECQLINIKEMTELENNHLAAIILLINSTWKHQNMLKLMGENLTRKKIFT